MGFPGIIRVPLGDEALEEACRSRLGLTMWTDGSRLDNRQVGAGLAWETPKGVWHNKSVLMGKGKEVFNIELIGVVKALEIAARAGGSGPITVLLNSQTAIA